MTWPRLSSQSREVDEVGAIILVSVRGSVATRGCEKCRYQFPQVETPEINREVNQDNLPRLGYLKDRAPTHQGQVVAYWDLRETRAKYHPGSNNPSISCLHL